MSPARSALFAAALCACAGAPGGPGRPSTGPAPAAQVPAVAAAPVSPRPLAPPPVAAPAPLAWPTATEALLPSGLRVVVVEHHRRPVLRLHLLLPTGTLADSPGRAGATRLAAQLLGGLREKDAAGEPIFEEHTFLRQVVDLGGAGGVDADPDLTAISVSGYPQDLTAYLQLVADAVVHPRRGEETFRERRNAAMDALEDLESSDPAAVGRVLAQVSFGPGHPYGRSELGTLASLARLGLEDVVAQQDRVLVPLGATLLVVGDVEPRAAIAAARTAFRRWTRLGPPPPSAPPAATAATPAAQPQRAALAFLRRQPASTLVLCAARPLPGAHGDDAALELLAAVLGRGTRSRLMAALREEHGLAYSASAEVVQRRWARAFLACAPVAAEQAGSGLRLFQESLVRLAAAPPTGPELDRARALLVADREELADDAAGLARAWLEALARGDDAPHPDRELAALRAVTPAELQRVARALLRPERVHWIASGAAAAAAEAAQAGGLTVRPVALSR